MIHPVILSGGSGTRLWPMSRSRYPKQLLSLFGRETLLQETLQRFADPVRFAPPLLVANEEHRFIIAEQSREIGVGPCAILLEPVGRNTAPAACIAALRLAATEPGAMMLLLPSDHAIGDLPAFRAAIERGAAAARAGYLVTFGITPRRAETGYGYIRRGAPLAGCPGAFAVAEFIEKPQAGAAEHFLAGGEYSWNSGMFLFPAALLVEELERLRPDIVAACRQALAAARQDDDFVRLDRVAFERCPAESIDYAVMEHTGRAAVVPADIGWSDIGSWDALWEMSPRDEAGNAVIGNVVAEAASGCYLRSEAGLVAAVGIEDLIVVVTGDAVMVAPRNRSQEVRRLVARLIEKGREEVDALPTVHRPWGTYKSLHVGDRVQVKHIVVKPGGKLSLQMHHHRAEHWVVVQGTAKIVRGEQEMILTEDQSTYIPLGTTHRLENPGKIPLHLIEVQSGGYLGEDDIIRFEDHYGRDR
ncbi:MAG: mannose-1-phosphate guanylyltransferase/mannose-6-phosphate isomerase [Alphaproteobacteria bacterium]|nr:mannose-1-phosphate guanylyltransferase/mannose-6-phosphate isomerase [Alphaproteobacteria bacterium]MBV9861945.1 mannose-1-phosphate guanylyltransferase/mannose-6-phosphate isomerase [Alphaproteobacteria bacterium]